MIRLLASIFLFVFILNGLPARDDNPVFNAYGHLWAGNYEAAIEAFSLAIETEAAPEYFSHRGQCFYYLKQYDEALSDFQQAKTMQHPEAILWLARCYAHQNNDYKTVQELGLYLEKSGYAQQKSIQKDSLFRKLHSTQAWMELWEDANQDEEEETIQEAKFLIRKGHYEQAHTRIESLIGQGFNEAIFYALNAEVYAQEENWQMSVYEINQALQKEQLPEYLLQKARYLNAQQDFSNASKVLQEYLQQSPYQFEVRYQLAKTLYQAGDYTHAREELDRCLKYNSSAELQLLSAKTYQKQGLYLDALRNLNPLLEQDSTNFAALSIRGITYYQTRTYKRAAYDLSMSLDLEPADAEANYYMALSQKALQQPTEACFFMKRARHLGDKRAHAWILEHCE